MRVNVIAVSQPDLGRLRQHQDAVGISVHAPLLLTSRRAGTP